MLMLWNIFGESSGAPEPAPVDHFSSEEWVHEDLLNCCRFPIFFAASSSTKRYMVDDLSKFSKQRDERVVS